LRFRLVAIAAVCAALCILYGCTPGADAGREIGVFFTCDTRGRLEPCGCFTGQYGGLTRIKTVLDAEAKGDELRLDVGDSIGGREDFDILQHRYMLRAFEAMKFDALNVGHREAQLTVAQLREMKEKSPVPILSANLLDKSSGKTIFDAYRIIERAGTRVAVIGVLEPPGAHDSIGDGLQVDAMESTLARLLPEIKSKADLIVLLAFADETNLAKLAQQFFEIKMILGGKVSQPSQEIRRENRSLVYYVTNEARALGMLRLQLKRGETMPAVMESEIRLLHDKLPQDQSFVKLAQSYRQEVRSVSLAVDDPSNAAADMVPGIRTAATFVGTEQCITCHESAAKVWEGSGHAHAFATLMDREADADPKCIACHTVGFGTHSGYRREFKDKKLVNVGCESCHGPGSLHVSQQKGDSAVRFAYRTVGPGDCKQCHYGEFSRPFDWNKFWPSIAHGKEGAVATTATVASVPE
jgi:hypothetical protein